MIIWDWQKHNHLHAADSADFAADGAPPSSLAKGEPAFHGTLGERADVDTLIFSWGDTNPIKYQWNIS